MKNLLLMTDIQNRRWYNKDDGHFWQCLHFSSFTKERFSLIDKLFKHFHFCLSCTYFRKTFEVCYKWTQRTDDLCLRIHIDARHLSLLIFLSHNGCEFTYKSMYKTDPFARILKLSVVWRLWRQLTVQCP